MLELNLLFVCLITFAISFLVGMGFLYLCDKHNWY